MGLCGMKCCLFVIVFLYLSTSFEASPFISDGIFGSHDSGEGGSFSVEHVLVGYTFSSMKNGAIGNIATKTQSLIPLSAAVVNLVRRALACSSNIACPASFEFQNYTIITSKCKGPEYPPDLCCSSFKEFACPFVDSLNDLRNDCAEIMFSYIYINGNYPTGLFASICREGKDGLECPGVPPPSMLSENANKNLSRNIRELLPITMLMVTSLALTLEYF